MSILQTLEKGNAEQLERSFLSNPAGFVAALSEGSDNLIRLIAQVIDSQSRVLGDALCAYMEQTPERNHFSLINLAAVTNEAWGRIEPENFKADYPGVLSGLLSEQCKKMPSHADGSNSVRVFYRNLFKVSPASRAILARNFMSFDPLDPRNMSPLSDSGEQEAMLPILEYLGHKGVQVKERIHQVIEAQINRRFEGGGNNLDVDVDYRHMRWLSGSEHFDLDFFVRATRTIRKEEHCNMATLRMVVDELKQNTGIDVLRCLIGNLGWDLDRTLYPNSLGEQLVDFCRRNMSGSSGKHLISRRILGTGLISLSDISGMLEAEDLAYLVVKESGHTRQDLMTVVADKDRLNLDRACTNLWRAKAKAYEWAPLPDDLVVELTSIIKTSKQPLDTAARSHQVLGVADQIREAICKDQEVVDLLSKQLFVENIETRNTRMKLIVQSLCEVQGAEFSDLAAGVLLEAYMLNNRDGIVDLHSVSPKLSASMLAKLVDETPYEVWIPIKEDIGQNLQGNQVFSQVLSIAANYKEIRYDTLDKLFSNFSWYLLEEFDDRHECFEEFDRLVEGFNAHAPRSDVCSLEDRTAFLEAISFIGRIRPFDYGSEGFVNQSWERFINAQGIEPAQAASLIQTDHSMLKARAVYESRGEGRVFLEAAGPKHRDAIFGSDLGL